MASQMFVLLLVSFPILFLALLWRLGWLSPQPFPEQAGSRRTMVHRLLKPRIPLDCPLCRLCSSEKNSFGASLHEEVSGPDCLIAKGQPELGLERARRIIHHILWQYRHRLMVELSPAWGESRVHPRMLREDLVDVCESFPSTKPLFWDHVPPQIPVSTALAACRDLACMNGMTSICEGRESLW
jgi:hypothetical protein